MILALPLLEQGPGHGRREEKGLTVLTACAVQDGAFPCAADESQGSWPRKLSGLVSTNLSQAQPPKAVQESKAEALCTLRANCQLEKPCLLD